MTKPIFKLLNLSVHSGQQTLLDSITLEIPEGGVFGLIGSSGAGKSTLLKTFNRMLDLTPGLRVSGQVEFHGSPLYGRFVDPDELRRRIGMLFQQPVIFPGSILSNVIFGVRHHGILTRRELPQMAEKALRAACLWDEVKDRLSKPATTLSIGQQQRLCLARTLACSPEVILMDEPTSALDPKSTELIEMLMEELSKEKTILLVTHNLGQADRLCSNFAELASGRVARTGASGTGNPPKDRAEAGEPIAPIPAGIGATPDSPSFA